MSRIHADLEPIPFKSVSGIVEVEVCTNSGGLATEACYAANKVAKEIFMKGTEPTEPCIFHNPIVEDPTEDTTEDTTESAN